MRKPTPKEEAYRWWISAMAGHKPERHDSEPQCGLFRMKRGKNPSYFVPVEIYLDQEIDENGELEAPERHLAWVDGKAVPAAGLWTYLTPISQRDYDTLCETTEARGNAPITSLQPVFPRRASV